jgi:transcription termination factor Rho
MYDILQLNDMLVPELLDIAEQLKIPNAKKLDKQEIIYKILDRQAVIASEVKTAESGDKGKRKRIVKTTTSSGTEEAVVESEPEKPRKAEVKKPDTRSKPELRKQEKSVRKKKRLPNAAARRTKSLQKPR